MPLSLVSTLSRLQFRGPAPVRALVRRASRTIAVRPGAILFGPGAGVYVDPDGTNPGYRLGTTEPLLQRALAAELRPGDTFYDIGACVGFFSLIAARLVGSEGCVYAFEPLPLNMGVLQRNVLQNGYSHVQMIEAAVGARSGRAEFVATRRDASHLARDQGEAGERISVKVFAIDDFLATSDARPPTFVKVDAEGSDLDVLVGAAATLRRHLPVVVVEVHWRSPELLEFFRAELPQYTVSGLDRPQSEVASIANFHLVARPRR